MSDPLQLQLQVSSSWWPHNRHNSISNHQPHDCLLNRLFRRRSKKTSKLGFTGLCVGNSPGTGEFPAQMASNAENVSIDDVIMSMLLVTCSMPELSSHISQKQDWFFSKGAVCAGSYSYIQLRFIAISSITKWLIWNKICKNVSFCHWCVC